MQVKKVAAGAIMGVGMGAIAFAGAGTASADNSNWTPGDGHWQPGAGLATLSSNVKLTSNNLNGAFSPKVGDVKILSGNSFSLLNGAKILSGNSFLNGNFSNNILNSGANSFNTTKTVTNIKDSYNTNKVVTVQAPKGPQGHKH